MRIFILEYLCSGAWGGELPDSLVAEGQAMLSGVVSDFAAFPGVEVVVTWDQRCGVVPFSEFSNVEVHEVDAVEQERELFHSLSRKCDVALVIAPEFDRILEQRCEALRKQGVELLNSLQKAIQLCTDKLATARHCEDRGIATVPTVLLAEIDELANRYQLDLDQTPIVVKLRDGAGTLGMQLFANLEEAKLGTQQLDEQSHIVQPFISGRAMSVAGFFSEGAVCSLNVVEQHLSQDRTLTYLGGKVSSNQDDQTGLELLSQLTDIGLRGYNGIDFIIPDEQSHQPLLVEVNPRLTSSYIGYRDAYQSVNLAAYFFESQSNQLVAPVPVTFQVNGLVPSTDDSKLP